MQRFVPSRLYLIAAASALGLAAFSAWWSFRWLPALIPGVLFLASAALVLFFALQPIIHVFADRLLIGRREILWSHVRRVDQTGWVAPLVAYLTLADGSRVRLLYPGDAESANLLLGFVQQRSTRALINGVPWKQIFGEAEEEARPPLESPQYRLLTGDDEAEVERLYQQLRSAGRFSDPEN